MSLRVSRVGLLGCSLALFFFVSAASAQTLAYPAIGDEDRVGKCHGNCGAGCSNDLNPCTHGSGWRFEPLGPPEYVRTYNTEFCADIDGGLYLYYTWDVYRAWGRYDYHGRWSPACEDHDGWCWSRPDLCIAPPNLPFMCDGLRQEVWSYEDYAEAQPVVRDFIVIGVCQFDPGGPIGPALAPPQTELASRVPRSRPF